MLAAQPYLGYNELMIPYAPPIREWFDSLEVDNSRYSSFRPLKMSRLQPLSGTYKTLEDQKKMDALWPLSRAAEANAQSYNEHVFGDEISTVLEKLEEDTQRFNAAVKYPGTNSLIDRQRLYLLAKTSPGEIMEIGVYTGTSTAFIAMGTEHQVYAVDPNSPVETEDDWRYDKLGIQPIMPICENLWSELNLANIHMIQDFSYNVCDRIPDEIGMLFLDGNHSLEAQQKDLEQYAGRIISGGIFVTHEWTFPGSWVDTFDAMKSYFYDRADEWIGPFRDDGHNYLLWFVKK